MAAHPPVSTQSRRQVISNHHKQRLYAAQRSYVQLKSDKIRSHFAQLIEPEHEAKNI
jgi:hypothetical protein